MTFRGAPHGTRKGYLTIFIIYIAFALFVLLKTDYHMPHLVLFKNQNSFQFSTFLQLPITDTKQVTIVIYYTEYQHNEKHTSITKKCAK